MADLKKKFDDLENRIQNLINSHQKLRSENESLKEENSRLEKQMGEERVRQKRLEEGFRELKEIQRSKNKTQITNLKGKVSEILSEIDRSVALMDTKS